MPKGSTKAEVHAAFKDRLTELRSDAASVSKSFTAAEQRVWQVPAVLAETELTDVPKLHEPAWNRNDINTNYATIMSTGGTSSGTIGDVNSLKYQIDYNAQEERAFRLRHATICRGLSLMHSRYHGHAVSKYYKNIEQQAADIIAAGGQ